MEQQLDVTNTTNADGNPSGGTVQATGLQIDWQNGPIGRGDDRVEPNGAFVETVLEAVKQRIEYYQASKFACEENAEALFHIEQALGALRSRIAEREARGVQGTYSV